MQDSIQRQSSYKELTLSPGSGPSVSLRDGSGDGSRDGAVCFFSDLEDFFFFDDFPDLDFDVLGSPSSSPWLPSFESKEIAASKQTKR
jgi:hypothetical protein